MLRILAHSPRTVSILVALLLLARVPAPPVSVLAGVVGATFAATLVLIVTIARQSLDAPPAAHRCAIPACSGSTVGAAR